LDAVIARIRSIEQAVRSESERSEPLELPGASAAAPPAHDKLAVRVQLRDPVVLAELRDVVEAVGILHHVRDIAELPGFLPRGAADHSQLRAISSVHTQTVVVRIADDQVAGAVEAQPARPAVAVIG